MRRTGRSPVIAALLLASAAALAGCAREGGYERTPPSRYAGTWQDRAGRELPDDHPSSEGFALLSYDGARHCDTQSVTYLAIAWPLGRVAASIDAPTVRQYVRDQHRHYRYRQVPFRGSFARDVPLPPDARTTGYHHGPYALWVSPSDADRHVYVQGPDGVERWARPAQRIGGCA
jgi:hypothetical protein